MIGLWVPIHQRPYFNLRRRIRRNPRFIEEAPSIFLPQPVTEKLHCRNEVFNNIEVGHSCMQGYRVSMEDQFIIDTFTDLPDHNLLAIMDGHSGTFAAEFTSIHMKSKIEETIFWREYAQLSAQQRVKNLDLLGKAFVQAYVNIDDDLRALKEEEVMMDESGCTAVATIITPTHIICANVGDSRCVIGTRTATISMSEDHKPDDPEEQARIKAGGGFVQWNRVNGELAMSRALGDFRYKQNRDAPLDKQLVICYPDISVHQRNAAEDWLMILACYGVWDVMSNDEGAVFTQHFISVTQADLQNGSHSEADEDDENQPASKRRKTSPSTDSFDLENVNGGSIELNTTSTASSFKKSLTDIPQHPVSSVQAATALINKSLLLGSMDNISAIVVKFPALRALAESLHTGNGNGKA